MPFLDDAGVRDEPRGPIWDAFAVVAEQVERLVAVNIAWSVHLLPAVLALAFPEWPWPVRLLAIVYTATALAPLTATLYGVVGYACARDHISIQLALDLFRRLALPGFRTLAPLYGTFGVLAWAWIGLQAMGPGFGLVAAFVQFVALVWLVCATYWGPLVAMDPAQSPVAVARRSVRLVWRYPAETLATAFVTLLACLIGAISVAGVFLIVPVLIAVLQTCRLGQLPGGNVNV